MHVYGHVVLFTFFMLKTSTKTIFVNRLTSSELRNVAFRLSQRAVLQAKTSLIAVRNRPFHGAGMRIHESGEMVAVFSCAFASMGVFLSRIRVTIINDT